LLVERRMRALTGLSGPEFRKLEEQVAAKMAELQASTTLAGQPRRRAAGGGRKGQLPSLRDKLLFILFYLKTYPTQDVMGALFGLSQPQVCARVNQWMPILQTLMAVQLPARRGRDLQQILQEMPEVKEVIIDGTERPLARPEHKGRRDRHYSQRRKRTTLKNVVVIARGRVELLTPTVPGRRHDKAEADRARIRLGGTTRLLGDLGFMGLEAGEATVCTPHRKPPGRALHWRHRRANRKLARERIGVEHAIASIKRLGILRQTLRAKRKTTADLVMVLGCGLHNHRMDCRAEALN
jgi:hypothetical protein